MPNKGTLHWTVGYYEQFFNDYHFMIAFDAKNKKAYIKKGIYTPEDNDNTSDGKYAPHCALCNTGNIGIAFCAMVGATETKPSNTPCPITKEQLELAWELCAELCIKYNFKPAQWLTHAERDKQLDKPSGKWDVNYLACMPELKANEVGAKFREKINWYYLKKTKTNLKYV